MHRLTCKNVRGNSQGPKTVRKPKSQNAVYKLILGGRIWLISSVIKGRVFLKGITGKGDNALGPRKIGD